MWLPLRLTLDEEKYAKENENLRRLLTKLFKFAFLRYRVSKDWKAPILDELFSILVWSSFLEATYTFRVGNNALMIKLIVVLI